MVKLKKEYCVVGCGYVAIFESIENRNTVTKTVKRLVKSTHKTLTDEEKGLVGCLNALEIIAYKHIYSSNKELFKSFTLH